VAESSAEPDAQDVAAFARRRGFAARFIRRMDLLCGTFWPVEGGSGGDCPRCNRLRLSSEGTVYPCLFSDIGFSVRELGPEEALRRAVQHKPASGQTSRNRFHAVGG